MQGPQREVPFAAFKPAQIGAVDADDAAALAANAGKAAAANAVKAAAVKAAASKAANIKAAAAKAAAAKAAADQPPTPAARTTAPAQTAPSPGVDPHAFILRRVVSAQFTGRKDVTPSGGQGSCSWHDAIVLEGGQNWRPSWGRMNGNILDDGNTTNGNGVGAYSVRPLDPAGNAHVLKFPAGMGFSVQFSDYC